MLVLLWLRMDVNKYSTFWTAACRRHIVLIINKEKIRPYFSCKLCTYRHSHINSPCSVIFTLTNYFLYDHLALSHFWRVWLYSYLWNERRALNVFDDIITMDEEVVVIHSCVLDFVGGNHRHHQKSFSQAVWKLVKMPMMRI